MKVSEDLRCRNISSKFVQECPAEIASLIMRIIIKTITTADKIVSIVKEISACTVEHYCPITVLSTKIYKVAYVFCQ